MSLLNPKFKISVFNEGLEFSEKPYPVNPAYSIYLPKENSTLINIIEKKNRQESKLLPKTFEETSLYSSVSQAVPIKNNEKQGEEEQMNASQQTLKNKKSFRIVKSPSGVINTRGRDKAHGTELTQNNYFTQNKSGLSNNRSQRITTGKIKENEEYKKRVQFKNFLFFDERTGTLPKSSFSNKVLDEILLAQDTIEKNTNLMKTLTKFKGMGVLKIPSLKRAGHDGIGKSPYIYNDYHLRSTNPGYSRGKLGTFYNRQFFSYKDDKHKK